MLPHKINEIKPADIVEIAALAQNLKTLPKDYIKMSIEDLINKVDLYIEDCEEEKNDPVNHPAHYTYGGVETIDYIEQVLGVAGLISFCLGNVIKYISRCEHKGSYREDLNKAQWYLNKAITKFNENMVNDTEW